MPATVADSVHKHLDKTLYEKRITNFTILYRVHILYIRISGVARKTYMTVNINALYWPNP